MDVCVSKNLLPSAADDGLNLLPERQVVPRFLQHPAVPRKPPLLGVVHGAVHPLEPLGEVLAETERIATRGRGSGKRQGHTRMNEYNITPRAKKGEQTHSS